MSYNSRRTKDEITENSESKDDPEIRRLLWHILGGIRGGENRARIVNEIRNRPSNFNQLATKLSLGITLCSASHRGLEKKRPSDNFRRTLWINVLSDDIT
jgi:hypothetical protein